MLGYTAREVAEMLDLPLAQVRAYAREGLLAPDRGPHGELRFSFQDLVILQTAKGLVTAQVPERKVRRALRKLKEQLPGDRPLTGVRIAAAGDTIVVRDGPTMWNPESGQVLLDFEVDDLARKIAPFAQQHALAAARAEGEETLDAEDWYLLGCELEPTSPKDARDAYERAVALDPSHADAWINLGRMLHEAGDLAGAEAHYRRALEASADSAIAAYNLGIVLDDQKRAEEAIQAYQHAIACDPEYAEAHYNLASAYERIGQLQQAIRHLNTYRRLTRDR